MNCKGVDAKDWAVEKEVSGLSEKTQKLTELLWNCTEDTKLDQPYYSSS